MSRDDEHPELKLHESEPRLNFILVMTLYTRYSIEITDWCFHLLTRVRPGLPRAPKEIFGTAHGAVDTAYVIVSYLILSPVGESVAQAGIMSFMKALYCRDWLAILIATLLLCAFHSYWWLPWGLLTFPGFLIFGYSFARWRHEGMLSGLIVMISIHSLSNLIPLLHMLR